MRAPPKTCSVISPQGDPCPKRAYARGWCHAHYTRWQRFGDVRAHIPIRAKRARGPGKPCEVPRCPRASWALGYCASHYARFRKSGGVFEDIPLEGREGGRHKLVVLAGLFFCGHERTDANISGSKCKKCTRRKYRELRAKVEAFDRLSNPEHFVIIPREEFDDYATG